METKELTYTIIGAAMEVHKYLGSGFQEVIYQRSLAYEFEQRQLPYVRECDMPVTYKGIEMGRRRVDFLIANQIMLELKAVAELTDVHLAQAKNYLEAYGLPLGLLINFGGPSLEYKRVYNNALK